LPYDCTTREIGLNGIAIPPDRLRQLRSEVVDQLVDSIREQGLLHPIIVKPRSETGIGFILVAGWHRLEAVRKLGLDAIRAEVRTGLNADAALLAEIDENLVRAGLSPAEEAIHIGARKTLYEKLHPETKHGAAPGAGKGHGKTAVRKEPNLGSFQTDAAKQTGKSRTAIARSGTRAKRIATPVLTSVIGTSLDKGEELDALTKLPAEQQEDLANRAAAGEKVSARGEAKKTLRDDRERDLAERTLAASKQLGGAVYGVIYADPPWRFEPYSRDTGMDRAADNHYPTMTTDSIIDLNVPAAKDCMLFLWATIPMLVAAFDVMAAWGFSYKSNLVWVKDKIGTGYWAREKHELLLIGVRGDVPAPAPGEQPDSVILASRGKHSEKPECFYGLIERMFPNLPKIELFSRGNTPAGWDQWGNEAQPVSEQAA